MNNTSKNDKDFLPYLEATMLALKARQRGEKDTSILKNKDSVKQVAFAE
jgi:hypothetical protein